MQAHDKILRCGINAAFRVRSEFCIYRRDRWIDYTAGPLTPALSPSEGERENHRQLPVYSKSRIIRYAAETVAGRHVSFATVAVRFSFLLSSFSSLL